MTSASGGRPPWDLYWLSVAQTVALRADCRRRRVGALVVVENRLWASGYNGTRQEGSPGCLEGSCPRGLRSYEEHPGYDSGNSDYGDCISRHAEINAIWQFQSVKRLVLAKDFKEIIVYSSHAPCEHCAKYIAEQGMVSNWGPDGQLLQMG